MCCAHVWRARVTSRAADYANGGVSLRPPPPPPAAPAAAARRPSSTRPQQAIDLNAPMICGENSLKERTERSRARRLWPVLHRRPVLHPPSPPFPAAVVPCVASIRAAASDRRPARRRQRHARDRRPGWPCCPSPLSLSPVIICPDSFASFVAKNEPLPSPHDRKSTKGADLPLSPCEPEGWERTHEHDSPLAAARPGGN